MLTRRRFVMCAVPSALLSLERQRPELTLHNGNFWTVASQMPCAQAVAIGGGRFLAAGTNDEILGMAGAGAAKVDLGQKTVLPGFIDAHSHPASSGLLHLRQVDCDLRSIRQIVEALQHRAARTPKGEWVLGFKYDDTKTTEGRPLTLSDLVRVRRTQDRFWQRCN